MIMDSVKSNNAAVPVFFACDSNYLPYLSVAVSSLADNASPDREYRIYVLSDGISSGDAGRIMRLQRENIHIEFINAAAKTAPLAEHLSLRDYYTLSIYYRIFIPDMFPQYDKAVYLDADVAVLSDIADMYDTEMGSCLVGAVPDAIIAGYPEYAEYAEQAVGVPFYRYFNSGVLLMNLAQMRREHIEEKFAGMLRRYGFDTICPDQDYLNVICRDRVLYLDAGWNKMSLDRSYPGVPHLVHYNMFWKPWHYRRVAYSEFFWKYASVCGFEDEIKEERRRFGIIDRVRTHIASEELKARALGIADRDDNFRCVIFGGEKIGDYGDETEEIQTVAGQA